MFRITLLSFGGKKLFNSGNFNILFFAVFSLLRNFVGTKEKTIPI